jgi:hypothetical protein
MSTLIFGILNICYALLTLSGPVMSAITPHMAANANPALEYMKSDPSFAALTKFGMCMSVLFGLALFTFGVGLLMLQNWARLGCIIYSVIAIVYTPIVSYIMWPYTKEMMARMPKMPPGMASGIAAVALGLGLVVGVGYAGLLLFFMTRSNVIDACQPLTEAPTTPA